MSDIMRLYSSEPLEPWETEEDRWKSHHGWRGESERHFPHVNESRGTSRPIPYDVSDIQQLAALAAQQLAETFALRREFTSQIAELERQIAMLKAAESVQPGRTVPQWFQDVWQELLRLRALEENECDHRSLEYGLRFVQMLSSWVPRPEVGVDPDGQVFFEWQRSTRWVFTASVSADGLVYYAGMYDKSRNHGVEELKHVLPHSIGASLRRFVAEQT